MNGIIEEDVLQIKGLLSTAFDISDYQDIERLGGLTNHTYKITLENGTAYAVRLPGEGTEELIDRANEEISTKLACKLGIDTRLLLFGEHGEKITTFIEGAQTMSPKAFCDSNIMKKAAETLRILHTCGENTGVSFDVFDMAAGYEEIISANRVSVFEGYGEIKKTISHIRENVSAYGVSLVPCHNDPLCENWVLGRNGKLYLIDWEYAGMNDAMWDLADASIEAAFTEKQDAEFLHYYFGRTPEYHEKLRFCANKLYLDYLWSLWGKARVPFDGEPMERYGQERFERLKNNLQQYQKQFPDEV